MSGIRVYVGGMSCRHCVRDVTARLRDVPGVAVVRADLDRERVDITGSMSVGAVMHALADTPYRVRVLDGADVSEPGADSPRTGDGQSRP